MTATRRKPKTEPAASSGRQGASQHRTALTARIRAWFGHHRSMAVDSLQRLWRRPISALMTWLVIGIALALPGSFQLLIDNLHSLTRQWDTGAQLSVFLKFELPANGIGQLVADLEARADVQDVSVIEPDQALAALAAEAGFADVLGDLEHNPLPTVLVLRPVASPDMAAVTEALRDQLVSLPEVDRVVLDLAWLQRLQEMVRVADRVALTLALLLSTGVVLVLGNTIRLEIENRREEIQVVKLVGGTDAFVRRPFLYMGLWYGLGGGTLAIVLVLAAGLWVGQPLQQLLALYGAGVVAQGPGPALLLSLAGGAALLGLVGAWVAVGRHLDGLDPT